MSTLLNTSRVQYQICEESEECDCLANLYFCMYCLTLRSADVLQHEIDSHFCPQTLDSLPTAEAPSKKNKSVNSWQCPACSHPLLVRATSTVLQSADDPSKPAMKKAYYQACNFCRWSSRGIGMPDKESVSGTWSEKANPDSARVAQLLDYFKYWEQKQKAELDAKKSKKRGYLSVAMQLQQKYGGTRLTSSSKSAISSSLSGLRLKENVALKEVIIDPVVTVGLDEVEKLPDDIYSQTVDFPAISSISQRHDQPEHQPESCKEFWPQKSRMLIKRSLRCKNCDHNIIKPEYNASSIKFKIHLVAVNYIPEVRVHKAAKFFAGEKSRVILTLINPTEHVLRLTLLPHVEEKKAHETNAEVELPTSDILLSKYDETAEFVTTEVNTNDIKDDPSVIAYRRGNKLGFYVNCTPEENLAPGEDVWISFGYKHEHYGNAAIVALLKGGDKPSEPEPEWLRQTVFMNLGKVLPK